MEKLFADILKSHDALQNIKFKVNGNPYEFYYRYLTVLEHTRIKGSCVKRFTTVNTDGSKVEKLEEQKDLYPVYTILEKALDENGKRLFSLTNREHYEKISKLPFELLSMIAAEMSMDITGNIEEVFNNEVQ